jgi:hypothetical protein
LYWHSFVLFSVLISFIVDSLLVEYRDHPKQNSKSKPNLIKEAMKIGDEDEVIDEVQRRRAKQS